MEKWLHTSAACHYRAEGEVARGREAWMGFKRISVSKNNSKESVWHTCLGKSKRAGAAERGTRRGEERETPLRDVSEGETETWTESNMEANRQQQQRETDRDRSQATRWSNDHRKYYSWQPHTNVNDTSHLRALRGAGLCVCACPPEAECARSRSPF